MESKSNDRRWITLRAYWVPENPLFNHIKLILRYRWRGIVVRASLIETTRRNVIKYQIENLNHNLIMNLKINFHSGCWLNFLHREDIIIWRCGSETGENSWFDSVLVWKWNIFHEFKTMMRCRLSVAKKPSSSTYLHHFFVSREAMLSQKLR